MIYYVIILTFLLVFFLWKFSKKKLLESLPIILIFLEIGKGASMNLGFKSGYNGLILMSLIAYIFLIIISKKTRTYSNFFRYLFAIYLIIAVYFFSKLNITYDNFMNIFSRYGNIIFTISFFFIGLAYVKDWNTIYKINRNFLHSAYIFIIITFVFTILQIGPSSYRGGVIRGPEQMQIYFTIIPILLYPVQESIKGLGYSVNNKWYVIIVMAFLIIAAFSLMRTVWLMFLISFFLYFLFIKKSLNRTLQILRYTFMVITLSYSVYISGVLDARSSRFNKDYEIENEGRIVEFSYVVNSIRENPIFGSEYFLESRGNYGFENENRPLHSTYSNILFGTGYLGLSLFSLFLLSILGYFLFMKTNSEQNYNLKVVGVIACVILAIGYFSATPTYGYGISFFSFLFFMLGAFCRILNDSKVTNKKTNGKLYISDAGQK